MKQSKKSQDRQRNVDRESDSEEEVVPACNVFTRFEVMQLIDQATRGYENDSDSSDEEPASSRRAAGDERKRAKDRLVINVANSQYRLVREIAAKKGYDISEEEDTEWDLLWNDGGVAPDKVTKMKPYQRTNHYPGMSQLARKNNLGRNLMKMEKLFPQDYRFFPRTWCFPHDYPEFKMYMKETGNKGTFIVKPEAMCQGRGIYLAQGLADIGKSEHQVVQKYIEDPYLIDGLKFDLRIYVLVYGINPL